MNPPGIAFYTPAEIVVGVTDDAREFWWCIDTNRTLVAANGLYHMMEGGLCGDHGLEGTMVDTTKDWQAGMMWVCEEAEQLPVMV